MKVFVCSPYEGIEENYYKAINYCKYVIDKGNVPLCPVTMLHNVLNDIKPSEHEKFQKISKELIKQCDEIWVFGTGTSFTGLNTASGSGKPIKYITDTFRFNDESEMLSVLCRQYETITGRTINRSIVDSMLFYINKGVTDKLVIEAIKKTALRHLGWNYTEGILRNCLADGIKTAEEFLNNTKKNTAGSGYATYDLDLYEKMLNNKD